MDAPDDNEISRGTPAGRVTDDTDQAVILGRLRKMLEVRHANIAPSGS